MQWLTHWSLFTSRWTMQRERSAYSRHPCAYSCVPRGPPAPRTLVVQLLRSLAPNLAPAIGGAGCATREGGCGGRAAVEGGPWSVETHSPSHRVSIPYIAARAIKLYPINDRDASSPPAGSHVCQRGVLRGPVAAGSRAGSVVHTVLTGSGDTLTVKQGGALEARVGCSADTE